MTPLPESLRKAAKDAFHTALEGPCLLDQELMWNTAIEWLWQHLSEEIAAAKYNYDHDTSNARTMAKRIAELENKLDLQIGQWLKAKDEANVLRSKLERLTRCSCGGGQISGLPPMKGTYPDACSQCGGWR